MPTNRNEFTRDQVRSQVADAVGGDEILYRLEADSEPFRLEHPMFRSKDTEAALEPLEDDDADGIAQVLLGEQYDRFIAEGGEPEEISRLMFAVGLKMRDAVSGRPTRSSTSSGSTRRQSKRR